MKNDHSNSFELSNPSVGVFEIRYDTNDKNDFQGMASFESTNKSLVCNMPILDWDSYPTGEKRTLELSGNDGDSGFLSFMTFEDDNFQKLEKATFTIVSAIKKKTIVCQECHVRIMPSK